MLMSCLYDKFKEVISCKALIQESQVSSSESLALSLVFNYILMLTTLLDSRDLEGPCAFSHSQKDRDAAKTE